MKNLIPQTTPCRTLPYLFVLLCLLLGSSPLMAQCCPPDVDALDITKEAYQFTGALDTNTPQLSNANFCLPYADTLPEPEAPRYRYIIPFQISTNDVIVIHTPADSTNNINESLFLALYQGGVDNDTLCRNLVAVSNVTPAENSDIRLAASLKKREPYALLVTTTTPMTTGDYNIQITTNQDLTEVFWEELTIVTNPDWTVDTISTITSFPTAPFTFSVPLNCKDDGLISSTGLELTGDPAQQPGCDVIENLTYQEEINQFQTCGPTFIKRTFSYNGPNGTEGSCIQRIILRPLSYVFQKDIWLPPANITVDCGYPCTVVEGEYPTPEETGMPFVLTVDGAYFLDDIGLCNVAASIYEDSEPIEACDSYYTFTRTWVILDWCDPPYVHMFEQHIQVGTAPCGSTIPSRIYTENGGGVANVEVKLTANGISDTVYTNSQGEYNLPADFAIDSTFTVEPKKDFDHFNGVSTFDLILISKHILGTDPLGSPYSMIAADVNNSGSITTLDLIQIRKLILGIIGEFPNNTSWRFVDLDFTFADPSDPWAGADTLEIVQSLWPADFVGIKVGDIDGSADPSTLQQNGDDITVRDGTPFYLHASAQQLQAGQSYNIPVFAQQLADIDGFQATLQTGPTVELLGIEGGLMDTEHFGPVQPDGSVAMSWVTLQQLPKEKQALFTLKIKARQSTSAAALHINAALLQPEAYGKDGIRSPVAFRFDAPATTSDVPQLRGNYPNPFRETTQVDFYLPTESPARLSVHNAIGQLVYSVELEGNAGWNTLPLDNVLPESATGVMHYTLEVGEHRMTKRMLRLR